MGNTASSTLRDSVSVRSYGNYGKTVGKYLVQCPKAAQDGRLTTQTVGLIMETDGQIALDQSAITARQSTRRMIKDAFVPPNPNEFDKTVLISIFLGVCGTRSIDVSTDGSSRFKVAGATPSRMARTE